MFVDDDIESLVVDAFVVSTEDTGTAIVVDGVVASFVVDTTEDTLAVVSDAVV